MKAWHLTRCGCELALMGYGEYQAEEKRGPEARQVGERGNMRAEQIAENELNQFKK